MTNNNRIKHVRGVELAPSWTIRPSIGRFFRASRRGTAFLTNPGKPGVAGIPLLALLTWKEGQTSGHLFPVTEAQLIIGCRWPDDEWEFANGGEAFTWEKEHVVVSVRSADPMMPSDRIGAWADAVFNQFTETPEFLVASK